MNILEKRKLWKSFNETAKKMGYVPSLRECFTDAKLSFCSCKQREPRILIDSLGRKHWGLQCQKCGAWEVVKKTHAAVMSAPENKPRDDYLAQSVSSVIRQEHRDWWRWRYEKYIASDEWKERRDRIMKKYKNVCQAGFAGCTGRAVQVHHLTYMRLGNEQNDHLIPVCLNCHKQIHPHMEE